MLLLERMWGQVAQLGRIGAALTDARRQFRAVRGYRDMRRLLTAPASRGGGVVTRDHRAA